MVSTKSFGQQITRGAMLNYSKTLPVCIQRIVRTDVPHHALYGHIDVGGTRRRDSRRNALLPDEMKQLRDEFADLLRYKCSCKYQGTEILQVTI